MITISVDLAKTDSRIPLHLPVLKDRWFQRLLDSPGHCSRDFLGLRLQYLQDFLDRCSQDFPGLRLQPLQDFPVRCSQGLLALRFLYLPDFPGRCFQGLLVLRSLYLPDFPGRCFRDLPGLRFQDLPDQFPEELPLDRIPALQDQDSSPVPERIPQEVPLKTPEMDFLPLPDSQQKGLAGFLLRSPVELAAQAPMQLELLAGQVVLLQPGLCFPVLNLTSVYYPSHPDDNTEQAYPEKYFQI